MQVFQDSQMTGLLVFRLEMNTITQVGFLYSIKPLPQPKAYLLVAAPANAPSRGWLHDASFPGFAPGRTPGDRRLEM